MSKLKEVDEKTVIAALNKRSNTKQAENAIVAPWGARLDKYILPYLRDVKDVNFAEIDPTFQRENCIAQLDKFGIEYDLWEHHVERYFQSDTYRLSFYIMPNQGMGVMGYIAFRRRDSMPIKEWREKQRIKDVICGTSTEAVELFPAWHRMVDSCNQYHLWFRPHGGVFPFGMHRQAYQMSNDDSKAIQSAYNSSTGSNSLQQSREERHVYNPAYLPNFGLLGKWWEGKL